MSFQIVEPVDERREALVEAVAREIRLRGLTAPAVHFLEASRPYRPLGRQRCCSSTPSLSSFRLAPAKVNLTLAVLGTRPDGYHDLHSVMVPIDLADRLALSVLAARPARHPPRRGLRPRSRRRQPRPARHRRRPPARRRHPRPVGGPPPLAARLDKRIPIAAGLAGGSSDAAAAVDAALEAWGVDADEATRHRIAAELGSDVPFFLAGGPALVEGRGERVTPLGWLRDAPATGDRPGLLIVTPDAGISTPAAFAAFDAGARPVGGAARLASTHLADELRNGLRVVDLLVRASVLAAANDLAPAAVLVEPGLVPFKRALLRLARAAHRAVGVRSDPLGHLSFSRRGGGGRRSRPPGVRRRRSCPAPGTRAPFVLATTILAGAGDPGRHP